MIEGGERRRKGILKEKRREGWGGEGRGHCSFRRGQKWPAAGEGKMTLGKNDWSPGQWSGGLIGAKPIPRDIEHSHNVPVIRIDQRSKILTDQNPPKLQKYVTSLLLLRTFSPTWSDPIRSDPTVPSFPFTFLPNPLALLCCSPSSLECPPISHPISITFFFFPSFSTNYWVFLSFPPSSFSSLSIHFFFANFWAAICREGD